MRREVEALENLELVKVGRRERIPDSVRLFVWQRDKGKCVRCGSAEKLEFDHIIPVVKGGSNTERNIQLLCERCNRKKGGDI
ncbi:MAG: HNH endonuclease [Proteobacteria bacterium]|nr:HNH endonuclease [Pseudomonadota bacterium]MBU4574036.1 HNH endonuclease [Pseudomonadota bacterium]MBU4599652.1 HNH endonuclease [Pseudomonadota bacterium]